MPNAPTPTRVYPRVCGGTWLPTLQAELAMGLSPRVRGNHAGGDGNVVVVRSIPACAGEPCKYCRLLSDGRVYPRVCGGTPAQPPCMSRQDGLSPRVRGNPRWPWRTPSPTRSIPACAGEPLPLSSVGCPIWVYPRVCGGTRWTMRRSPRWPGLSPRVRGNPFAVRRGVPLPRSIPACAGEPSRCGIAGCLGTVYPRVCGGTMR